MAKKTADSFEPAENWSKKKMKSLQNLLKYGLMIYLFQSAGILTSLFVAL